MSGDWVVIPIILVVGLAAYGTQNIIHFIWCKLFKKNKEVIEDDS